MKNKQWLIPECDFAVAGMLSDELGLSRLAARVLAARGLKTCRAAGEFMDKSLSRIHDPFLLDGMDEAAREIESAIANGVRIAVYGDYDVDGVTATCILIKYLRSRGAVCDYYIPDRLGEGYGLNTAAIAGLYEQGCRLLITVDSGITAVQEAEFAAGLGMRLIITDHHECKGVLPAALAVINPRRDGSRYPFRELAGVGVAFQLICALEKGRSLEQLLAEYSDIVSVGTIADVMPLIGENSVIVSRGLKALKTTKNPGLRALMQKLGLDTKPLTANAVSFVMAPRINAAGRLGGASAAAQMFLTEDMREAAELAEHLCELNRRRQEEENAIYSQIAERIRLDPQIVRGNSLTLWGDDWHNGVIGIVASRLADKYGIPCVLISMSGDSGKGSGRSVKGFNMYTALEKSAGLIDKFGGHELAVGLSVSRDNLEALRDAIEACAAGAAADVQPPGVAVDCSVEPEELTVSEIAGLSALEPFGMGNPQPAFAMTDVLINEITPISNDRHTKFLLAKNGRHFYAFAFGMGARNCAFASGDSVDIVFSAEINEYKNKQSVQLIVKDIRWSTEENSADTAALEMYAAFRGGENITDEQARILSPTKDELRAVFSYIRTNAEGSEMTASARAMYRKVRYNSRGSINLGRFLVCMDVFREFDIFTYSMSGDDLTIVGGGHTGKADISGSRILKQLMDSIRG